MNSRGPLSGLKVVDFSRVLAGPHCTKTLSDLGADVIKIEPPRGDISRLALPGDEGASMSLYYIQQNAGKRNISIDLNFPEGRDVVLKMCDSADIIVENFRAGTLSFFGLDYKSISARNPKVIYASISGYGQGGPLSHRSAYAPTVHAESGFVGGMIDHLGADLAVKRHDAYSHADIYTGLEAIIGILAALHHRDRTGEGQHVDVAMAATMLAVNERVHADLSGEDLGAEPAALGPADSPFFGTSYGDVVTIATSVVSSLTFPNYIAAMRRPDLAKDPRFCTPEARRRNLHALYGIIQQWILSFPTAGELDAQLDEVKLAFGVVRSVKDFADSEWVKWWGAIEEVTDRRGKTVRIPGKPWKFSKVPLDPAREAAYRGEHNAEVMKEYGYLDKDVSLLTEAGILLANIPQRPVQMSDTTSPHDPTGAIAQQESLAKH
jgi:crotonobetainyl-CoA:carnitine CoA-transferase CaiB-like acyl-CoA transferase